MQVLQCRLEGPLLFSPQPHRDERGFFTRTFDASEMRDAGIDPDAFVQDNQSRSTRGVIRGMHGRVGRGEAKLVRVANGAVFDCIVDVRAGSPTFGEIETFTLDDEGLQVLYVPRGFLHGHQTLSPTADVCYRIDAVHDPSEDVAVHYRDRELAIRWPEPVTVVSERDRAAGSWASLVAQSAG